MKLRQQFADTMLEVGKADQDLVVLVSDMSHFLLQPFAQACPGRFYNLGICEQSIVGVAAGLAKLGFKPVIHTMASFLVERCFEQLKLDFCHQGLGGVLVALGGGFDNSTLGPTHHSYSDFALMKALPGARVVYPGSPEEFDSLFRQCYRDPFLTYFRVPVSQHGVPLSDMTFGQGVKVTTGEHCTIICTGPHLRACLDARDILGAEGISVEVLYIHTIRPLDVPLVLESVARTGRVLVVEDHMDRGGLSEEVLRTTWGIVGTHCDVVALNGFVAGYGRYEAVSRRLGFSAEGIAERVRARL